MLMCPIGFVNLLVELHAIGILHCMVFQAIHAGWCDLLVAPSIFLCSSRCQQYMSFLHASCMLLVCFLYASCYSFRSSLSTSYITLGVVMIAFFPCSYMTVIRTTVSFPLNNWGFAKFYQFQKCKINLDRAHPTHPPPIQTFFGNPPLTWTEHSDHNN